MSVDAGIFRRAIDVIRERGWRTGTLGDNYGYGAVCINGALMAAQGLDLNYHHYGTGSYSEVAAEIVKTLDLQSDCAGPAGAIQEWNDRTWGATAAGGKKAVIEALERTAERLEVKQFFIYFYDGETTYGTKGIFLKIHNDGNPTWPGKNDVDAVQRLLDQHGSVYRHNTYFLVGAEDGRRLKRINIVQRAFGPVAVDSTI